MKNKDVIVLSIKKVNRLLDGSCVRIFGYDSLNGRLKDLVVPFYKVYVNEDVYCGECLVTLNFLNCIHRVDVSSDDVESILCGSKKSLVSKILGGM